MKVELLNSSTLYTTILAARTCYDSVVNSDSYTCPKCNFDKYESGIKDEDCEHCGGQGYRYGIKDISLLERLLEDEHMSVFEHIYYTFHVKDVPRYLLQEISRHRIASLSVKSTRFTLKELKYVDFFTEDGEKYNYDVASKFIKIYNNSEIDDYNIAQLIQIQNLLIKGYTNDQVKPLLPEAYLTELVFTINVRSFINLLKLRTSKRALADFRYLCTLFLANVPVDHILLYQEFIQNSF